MDPNCYFLWERSKSPCCGLHLFYLSLYLASPTEQLIIIPSPYYKFVSSDQSCLFSFSFFFFLNISNDSSWKFTTSIAFILAKLSLLKDVGEIKLLFNKCLFYMLMQEMLELGVRTTLNRGLTSNIPFNGHELQDTIKSSPPENKAMKRASFVGILITTLFYVLCGSVGYAAFGDDAPGNFLTGFGFYEPFWLIDFANVCIAVHLIGAYQV